jgi:hypothetical protein
MGPIGCSSTPAEGAQIAVFSGEIATFCVKRSILSRRLKQLMSGGVFASVLLNRVNCDGSHRDGAIPIEAIAEIAICSKNQNPRFS